MNVNLIKIINYFDKNYYSIIENLNLKIIFKFFIKKNNRFTS